jgi:Peptidase family S41
MRSSFRRTTPFGWGLGSLFILMSAIAPPVLCDETRFDTTAWIEDLHQIRSAMTEKYANFEWAVFERDIDLSGLFDKTEARLRSASSDQDAKAIIDRSLRAIGDGHLRVRWPTPAPAAPASTSAAQADVCSNLGYDVIMRGQALGPYIPGYRALADTVAPEFPAGLVNSGATTIGVIRIGLFSPQGYPELCASTRDRLAIPSHSQCDQHCVDGLESAEYAAMSRDLALRIKELERLGSTILLIDITGNGGGSEWAEAAARIVAPLKLRSERRYGVRGAHWADYWELLAQELRRAEQPGSAADTQQLQSWMQQVEEAKAAASTPCSSAAFWSGHHPDCEWLAPAFYATGLLAQANATVLHKKSWGSLVFSPAQYDFEESVWRGPLLVLVDGGTGSAAGEFAAVLQDNKAAVIMGAPAESGCGHTNGGTPTTLTNSHGILEVPDCVRVRLDGSNEMRGIDPDILVGFNTTDGMRRKGLRVARALSQGIPAAVQLCRQERCSRAQPRSFPRKSLTGSFKNTAP